MNTKTTLLHTGLFLALGLPLGACDAPDIGDDFPESGETGDIETGDEGWDDESEGSSDDGADDGDDDDDGADDDGGADDGDSGAEPACGDSVLDEERGEECDDGNLDEVDGCLSTCRLGPTGLHVDYGVSSPLEVRGGAEGIEFDQECPEDEVIIGVVGRSSAVMDQVQVRCGAIELTSPEPGALSVNLVEGAMLEPQGGQGGSAFSLGCEEGHAVVSFSGHSGALLERLALTCAPVMLKYHPETGAPSVGFGEVVQTGMVGGGSGPAFSSDCPAGQVATSVQGRSEEFVNALGMACRPLALL